MKALVVYDSVYGNTEQIAKAVAAGIAGGAQAVRVGAAGVDALKSIDLLVVGSPTLGGRPTAAMKSFIDGIPQPVARRLRVAAFDTRVSMKFARIFGWAAARMAEKLTASGSSLKAPPEGFIVKGRSGPLAEGETERAKAWAKGISNS
jgi:flavodoxin